MSGVNDNLKIFEDSFHSLNSNSNATARPYYRRSSLATTLHANLLVPPNSDVVGSARRRLSNVSDVVSRKISRTMGWKLVSVPVELTVSQGSSLCAQYIRNRLKRSGIFHRKLGLKRMRSSTLLPDVAVVSDVSPVLIAIGTELEKANPKLYVRIGRQTGCGSFSDQTVAVTMTHVSREIIRHGEITWSKIISIYAVAGGIAVDCVRQGKPEFLLVIQKALASVLEQDLAIWIQTNGGWSALASRYRSPSKTPEWNTKKLALLVAVITPIVFILAIVIRLL